MRLIRTIILRLLIDTDQPQALRGVLQDVGEGEQHSFTDEQSLLEALQWLSMKGEAAAGESERLENSWQVDLNS